MNANGFISFNVFPTFYKMITRALLAPRRCSLSVCLTGPKLFLTAWYTASL